MKGITDVRDVVNDRMNLYSGNSNISLSGVKPLRRRFSPDQPITGADDNGDNIMECRPLNTDGNGNFIDESGRKVVLKGINLDTASKIPVKPYMPTYKGNADDGADVFFDGDNVSFVGRPFPIEEAEQHFQRIKSWGYNTIRYVLTWEAIEHKGPGIYDEEFIDYTIKILQVIHDVGGLYVFLDLHQDVWSRFSGGSGAPLWTFYAAGMQPKRFSATEAALLHNEPRFKNAESFPKMIWPTNYSRLASLTMFTLFFAGKNYFPHLEINGRNIQTYLQDHFLGSMRHLWKRVAKHHHSMVVDGTLLGFETMNEPNCGLMGHSHLGYLAEDQHLRVGTTPTVYQCFRLGMGLPCEVDVYRIALTGPQKAGTEVIDPKGEMAWLTKQEGVEIDKHYNWKRGKDWVLGDCLFAQLGIWSHGNIDYDSFKKLSTQERVDQSLLGCELIKPNYFNQFTPKHNFTMYSGVKPKSINMDFFINHNFVDFAISTKKVIRALTPDAFFLLQPPVLQIPPNLKTDPRGIIDSKTIYAPHYYDGMSLMFKTWNYKYNVDTFGIMRGRYMNPALGIVFGERAIRNCLKKQFVEMKKECEDFLGLIPILMSETGMPFDMDDKKAYNDGKYISQTSALDALSYALEGLNMSHTYWCYTSINSHKWGDRWNNEDFSFWSPEDRNLTFKDETSISGFLSSSVISTAQFIKSARARRAGNINTKVNKIKSKVNKNSLNEDEANQLEEKLHELDNVSDEETADDLDDVKSLQDSSLICWTAENVKYRHTRRCYPSPDGVRAVSAVIRPYVVASSGGIIASEFDLRSVKFSLTMAAPKSDVRNKPTIIYVPKWHYPKLSYNDIYLTSGHIKYNERLEYLEWYLYDESNGSSEGISESSTLVNESIDKEETLIIKNNSGTIDSINNPNQNSGGCVIS